VLRLFSFALGSRFGLIAKNLKTENKDLIRKYGEK